MSWQLYDHPSGRQCVPDDDIIEHKPSPGCECCPVVEHRVVRNHHPMYMRLFVIHEAMDGRPD